MFSSLLRTFLSPPCPLCERPGHPVFCRDCERQLDNCQITSTTVVRAGRDSAADTSDAAASSAASPSPIFAWGTYGGALKRAIHLMKYENRPEIGSMLGQRLGESWLARSAQYRSRRPLVLVPVPLHRDRLRQRGYNQAELIASRFSTVTGVPCLPAGLLRVKATAAQHQLSPKDRRHNLKGAFRLGPDWTIDRMSSRVLLVDDIYTTGTTARAAATELRRAGISVMGIAAAAQATFIRSGREALAA